MAAANKLAKQCAFLVNLFHYASNHVPGLASRGTSPRHELPSDQSDYVYIRAIIVQRQLQASILAMHRTRQPEREREPLLARVRCQATAHIHARAVPADKLDETRE